jgi:hypothetical protein
VAGCKSNEKETEKENEQNPFHAQCHSRRRLRRHKHIENRC